MWAEEGDVGQEKKRQCGEQSNEFSSLLSALTTFLLVPQHGVVFKPVNLLLHLYRLMIPTS